MKCVQIIRRDLNSEKGQAIILLVFGMVALLGFTALAVDGSMVYADRRYAQNSADSSSLAGGGAAALYLENHHVNYNGWNCGSSSIASAMSIGRSAAISSAANNGLFIDADISDQNGVQTDCGTHNNGSWIDKYIDLKTMITSETHSSLTKLVFSGDLKNTVEAITRVRPPTGLAFGYAVAALRENCPNANTGGVHYDGNASISVTGGGIFSNACMVKNGNVSVSVTGAPITCIGSGCWINHGGAGSVSPIPQEGINKLPLEMYEIPAPDCASLPNRGSHSGGGTIQPGRYNSITIHTPHSNLILQPGLYCISGDFSATGGTIIGNGVTIFLQSGEFKTRGNAVIQLAAPPGQGPGIPGVLIYSSNGNTSGVTLAGTSDSEFTGLVFAPNGPIDVGGTSSEISEIHAQIIGDTVKLHGTTDVLIHYDDNQIYHLNAMLELLK